MNDQPDDEFGDLDEGPEIEYVDEPKNKVQRGEEFSLTRKDPAINHIRIGLGWDLKGFDNNPPDLDASLFLLDKNDQTRVDEDFVFYNNMNDPDGAVKHTGDSRTGAGDGDDEIILVELNALPFDVSKICFVLSIYDMEFEGHNFSMVRNVYFRIINEHTNHELFRFELDEELTAEGEGLIIGELERMGAEWIFHAVGNIVDGGLGKIAEDFGIMVTERVRA